MLPRIATLQCFKLSCQAQLSCRGLTCCLCCKLLVTGVGQARTTRSKPNESKQSRDICCRLTKLASCSKCRGPYLRRAAWAAGSLWLA